jgi:hypothetical protein
MFDSWAFYSFWAVISLYDPAFKSTRSTVIRR